jgi:hypothetical protein
VLVYGSTRDLKPRLACARGGATVSLDIYDAALDPELWIDVLEKAAKFVGGPAASIYFAWGCFPDFWWALAKRPLVDQI